MRDAPDKNAKVLAYIPSASTELQLDGPCGEKWCRITFRGLSGWAYRGYLNLGALEDTAAPIQPAGLTTDETGGSQSTALTTDAFDGKLYTIEGASAEQPLGLRETPDDGAPIKGMIPYNGKQIEGLKKCVGKWCLVRYNGVVGWTARRHLAEDSGVEARKLRVVNMDIADVLPVREYPGEEASAIGSIPSYASGIVQIGGCDKIWCHVRYLGVVGWVSSRYIAP